MRSFQFVRCMINRCIEQLFFIVVYPEGERMTVMIWFWCFCQILTDVHLVLLPVELPERKCETGICSSSCPVRGVWNSLSCESVSVKGFRSEVKILCGGLDSAPGRHHGPLELLERHEHHHVPGAQPQERWNEPEGETQTLRLLVRDHFSCDTLVMFASFNSIKCDPEPQNLS